MLVLGIDEAGRGPVVGPMVIAGVLLKSEDLKKLKDLGVKDSKELSEKKREFLYKKIKELAVDFVVVKISAKKIDELRKEKSLNIIEAENIAKIIQILKPDIVYIDSPQSSTDKFKKILIAMSKTNAKVICENYADKNYVACAAASIIAKVERDREIRKIEKKHGIELGTGYSHDEKTIEAIKRLYKQNGKFPDFVRKSWITAKEIAGKLKQRKLKDF